MNNKNIFYDKNFIKREIKAKIFKTFAMFALVLSLLFLIFFLGDMIAKGSSAIWQSYIQIEVVYDKNTIKNPRKAFQKKFRKLISRAWVRDIARQIKQNPKLIGTTKLVWALADDQVDMYMKGYKYRLKTKDLNILKILIKNNKVKKNFNKIFFTKGDSKIPEYSGILSAMIGTILTLLITMSVSFPIGVATAIYLEEFLEQNSKISKILEININNLVAIPSILFGLLGLAVFINLFGIPRSSALVGGLTLSLMTLPIIVVATRASLRGVPSNIRQAGYGLGLTKVQVVKDHVLPLAFPGIMTGTILGLAQAIGETAPLIIVGMVAFVPDIPVNFTEATTVMPAQIFTWASMPHRAYVERTALGILVLLTILILLNALAIILRKKFEIRW
jgi:phosphate transport system permease protein